MKAEYVREAPAGMVEKAGTLMYFVGWFTVYVVVPVVYPAGGAIAKGLTCSTVWMNELSLCTVSSKLEMVAMTVSEYDPTSLMLALYTDIEGGLEVPKVMKLTGFKASPCFDLTKE